jgi:hypothetical protein
MAADGVQALLFGVSEPRRVVVGRDRHAEGVRGPWLSVTVTVADNRPSVVFVVDDGSGGGVPSPKSQWNRMVSPGSGS